MTTDEAINILEGFVQGFPDPPEEAVEAVKTLRKARRANPTSEPVVAHSGRQDSEGWKDALDRPF